MEPGGREPAPGGLRLVQAFINSSDIEEGTDEWGSPEQLRVWLAGHGLPGGEADLTGADLKKAVEAREALRVLAAANSGEPLERGAAAALNRIAAESALVVRFGDHGVSQLEPARGGLDGALGSLLAAIQTAMVDGTWQRLKVCRNDTCRWAFYDHSKNRSGAWCTMTVCGDRVKARAYRRRRRSTV